MRKALIFFTFVLIAVGGAFFSRHQLLMVSTKAAINRSFPQAVVYKKMAVNEGRIAIGEVHAHQNNIDLTLENVEFGLNFKEVLKNPRPFFDLIGTKTTNWIQALVPMKQYGVNLGIGQGVLQLDEFRYYFQLKKGEKKHEIATLIISDSPNISAHPCIVVQFHLRQEQVVTQISVEQVTADRFLKLATFAFPELLSGFEEASGILQLHANAVLEKNGQVEEFSSRFACENFEIHYPQLQFAVQMDHFVGNVNYPEGINHPGFPLWKRMQCGLFLEKGNMVFGENLSLSNLEGSLALDPHRDPVLDLHGELVGHETPLALHLGGKGTVYDDRAYWLEFALNLDDRKGTECGAFLSICRPEVDSLVFQLEAENLLPSQVEMLKCYFARSNPALHHWTVSQGSFGGKLVALFEKTALAHFEVQDLIGENVVLASDQSRYQFKKITGEGRLFDSMNFNIELLASEFFSLVSPEFKEIFSSYRPEDRTHLVVTTQFKDSEVEVSAHVDFLEAAQTLQFGYKSPVLFPRSLDEITDGWGRSEKLNHLLYGPFVRMIDPDLEIYGEMDAVIVYEGKKLEVAVQVDEFLSKHPLFDIKAAAIGAKGRTDGRARLVYDFATKSFQGAVPLRGARAYERQYGLGFRDLDTELTFSFDECKAHVTHTNITFDGSYLLTDAQFDVTFKEETTLTSLLGRLPLNTDKEYVLNVLKLTKKSCDAKILEGKDELAHFVGEKEKEWKGNLEIQTLGDPLDVSFNWDPLTNFTELDAVKKGLHLHCTKQGSKIAIEKLALDDFLFQAVFSKEEDDYVISHFEVQRSDLYLDGSGTFAIELPKRDTPLGVVATLSFASQTNVPIPLALKTVRPFKFAYSPCLGAVLADLELQAEGCQLNIGHLEHHHETEKTTACRCRFDLSKELLDKLIARGVVPALVQDFQFLKTASGAFDWTKEKGAVQFRGKLASEGKEIALDGDWKNHNVKLSLSQEGSDDSLAFQARFDEGIPCFDSIKGSLDGVCVDLKKRKKDELKGHIVIDSTKLGTLLDLPLANYLSLWKVDGKYQLDGIFTPRQRVCDWDFRGKLKGHGVEWGGYHLRSVEARVDYESGKASIENLDISDDAGKLWVGEGLLERTNDMQWMFSLPLVEIRGFVPSSLTKAGARRQEATPLMIKAATLKNARGKIDDLSSIVAEGSLRFQYPLRKGKEQYPKNFPKYFLQQMGLDGGILLPAAGEMRYSIQNGRCYLRGFDAVVSDKRRSEFQPPKNGSIGYIDFDGSLFVDVQVKQNIVRSASSALNVKIRGTWEEPQFTIK